MIYISRSNYERETIINFNEEELTASIYTFNRSLTNKLTKLSQERPEECKVDSAGPEDAASFIVPKKWIKVKPPATMNLTDEQKKERSDRMKAIQQSRANANQR